MTENASHDQDGAPWRRRIIIGGLPRAGTTLFRLVLDSSAHIICPPETGFFLKPFAHRRARLEQSAHRIDRALHLGEEAIAECIRRSETSIEAFDRMMGIFREAHRLTKPSWAEKSPRNCFSYPALAELRDDLHFISVIRDGRSVVTSRMGDAPTYHCDIERYVSSMQAIFGFDHPNHRIIRYEDMVTAPIDTYGGVFEFVGLPFDESIVRTYASSSPTRNVADHRQELLGQPINSSRVQRWQQPEYRERVDEFMKNADAAAWLARSGYS